MGTLRLGNDSAAGTGTIGLAGTLASTLSFGTLTLANDINVEPAMPGRFLGADFGAMVLNDPVSRYLPAFKNLQVSVPRVDAPTGTVGYALVPVEEEMTIHDLLRHTAGLVYEDTSHPEVRAAYLREGVTWKDVTPAEQIARLARVPLAHQPGTAWEYSFSIDVAGRVIEAITGTTLGQFLQERVFAPLQMVDTGFVVPPAKAGRLAQPFSTDPVTGEPVTLLDVTVPPKNDAGGAGAVGTAADYARGR